MTEGELSSALYLCLKDNLDFVPAYVIQELMKELKSHNVRIEDGKFLPISGDNMYAAAHQYESQIWVHPLDDEFTDGELAHDLGNAIEMATEMVKQGDGDQAITEVMVKTIKTITMTIEVNDA